MLPCQSYDWLLTFQYDSLFLIEWNDLTTTNRGKKNKKNRYKMNAKDSTKPARVWVQQSTETKINLGD